MDKLNYNFNNISQSLIKISDENNEWRVDISNNIKVFIDDNTLPYTVVFLNTYTNKNEWKVELSEGMWATYKGVRGKKVIVYDKQNNKILEKDWDRFRYGDLIENILTFCIKKCNLTNGLIVGAGSGSYGEWIDAVKNNLTSAVLIEPDVVSFNQLYENYSTYKNLTFLNIGADIRNGMSTFWISPDVSLSSIMKQNSLNYGINVDELIETKIETRTIDSLINEYNIDWLRLDAEGMDYNLINSISINNLKKLKYIQYEHINITEDEKISLNIDLENIGFKVFMVGIDMIGIR
jgi:FkbM family methyltransferase